MSIEQARNSLGQSIQELNTVIDVNEDISRLQELSLAHSEVATIRFNDTNDTLSVYLYHVSEGRKHERGGTSVALARELGSRVIDSLDGAMNHLVPALDNEEVVSKVGFPDDLQSLRGRLNAADIHYIAAMHEYRYAKRVRTNFLEARELAEALYEHMVLPIGLTMNDADQFGFTGIRRSVELLQQSVDRPTEQLPVILDAALEAVTEQDLHFVREVHRATGECSHVIRSSLQIQGNLMEIFGQLLKDLGAIQRRL